MFRTELQLLPSVFDRRALKTPDKPWAAIPIDDDDLTKGTQDVSWKCAADAINVAAWYLEKQLGRGRADWPTVAYNGPSDLRYIFLAVALMKLGYKVLLLHASLSREGLFSLLDKTGCTILLHDEDFPFDDLVTKEREQVVVAPPLSTLMASQDVKVFPYVQTLQEGLMQPGLILHTSGTTGLPKPVVLPLAHQAISARLIEQTQPSDGHPLGYSLFQGTRLFVGFPLAHSGGVNFSLFCSMCADIILVFVASKNLSGSTLKSLINHAGVSSALTMPRVLIEAAQEEETLKAIEELKILVWSGGHIPKAVGEALKGRTQLMSSWGTTESGMHVLHTTDPEDWDYNHFNPSENSLEFRPVTQLSDNGPLDHFEQGQTLFEAVAVRKPGRDLIDQPIIFSTYPDVDEWRYGDLWTKHPSKRNHWRYAGRIDDMIVLDSGHNFHPSQYEQAIVDSDPRVRACVIIGSGRPTLAVILELDGNDKLQPVHELQRLYWPTVQRINERSNKQAQISFSGLIFTNQLRSLPRTPKGSVSRAKAQIAFEREIDNIYEGRQSR